MGDSNLHHSGAATGGWPRRCGGQWQCCVGAGRPRLGFSLNSARFVLPAAVSTPQAQGGDLVVEAAGRAQPRHRGPHRVGEVPDGLSARATVSTAWHRQWAPCRTVLYVPCRASAALWVHTSRPEAAALPLNPSAFPLCPSTRCSARGMRAADRARLSKAPRGHCNRRDWMANGTPGYSRVLQGTPGYSRVLQCTPGHSKVWARAVVRPQRLVLDAELLVVPPHGARLVVRDEDAELLDLPAA